MVSHQDQKNIYLNIANVIRLNSKQLFEHDCGGIASETKNCDRNSLAFNQHLSFVLICHTAIKILYTAHFMYKDARNIASKKYHIDPKRVSNEQAIDYFKEFCNVASGYIGRSFADHGLEFSHSLAFAIQGYNDIFFGVGDDERFVDSFTLESKIGKLGISLEINVNNFTALSNMKNLNFDSNSISTNSGNFEIL